MENKAKQNTMLLKRFKSFERCIHESFCVADASVMMNIQRPIDSPASSGRPRGCDNGVAAGAFSQVDPGVEMQISSLQVREL